MASELLFDFDSIDKNAIAMTHEAVGAFLPQTGPMRMLDHVVWMDKDTFVGLGVKKVRHDEFWVPHHIPGRPLLPGVLMLSLIHI